MKIDELLKASARAADKKRLFRWLPGVLILALLASAWAFGQGANDMPSKFCYSNDPLRCSDTLEGAEQIMRNAQENTSVSTLVEPYVTEPNPITKLATYWYFVRDQPGTVYGPTYLTGISDGNLLNGVGYGCAPGNDPNRSSACASEDDLVAKVMGKYRSMYPACTFSPETLVDDQRLPPYKSVNGNTLGLSTYGDVDFGLRVYSTTKNCAGTATIYKFRIVKQSTFTCLQNYTRLSDSTPNDGSNDLTLPVLCKYDGPKPIITGPIKQTASCAASKYPCYPATGDKARTEPDFAFAGRTFTRYYHSLHELTYDPSSAIGWSHTFGDHLFGSTGQSRISVTSESGTYESYVYMDSGRYRAENSMNKWIQPFASGTVRWRLFLPSGEYRDFDAGGLLLKIGMPADPRLDIVMTYANGLLSKATDGLGRSLSFQYDQNKMLRRVVMNDGSAVGYTYDAYRNLTEVAYPNQTVRKYLYAESGLVADPSQRNLMTGIVAEDGQRYASFKYDLQGRVIESRAFGQPNNVTTVTYSADTSAVVGTDTGDTKTYTIEPGQYRHITGMQSQGQQGLDSQTYDAAGRLQASTDKRGVVTAFEYEATNSALSAVVEAAGTTDQRRFEIVRDAAINRPTEHRALDASGVLQAKISWSYNARAQATLVSAFDPTTNATRESRLRYCEATDVAAGTCPMLGLLVAADGPRTDVQDVSTFVYRSTDDPSCTTSPANCGYRKGDLWKVANALGQSMEYLAYDGAGRVRSVRDANGVRTDVEYDARGWMTASKIRGADDTTEADDRITRIEYDPVGTVHRTLLPDGSALTYAYDPLGRLTAVVDTDGNRLAYTLDAAGNVVREDAKTAAGGIAQTVSRVYDTLGRLQSIVDSQSNRVDLAYDEGDNLTLSTDPLTRKTARTYDALGRLRSLVQDVGGIAARTETSYDALGRVKRVTDPSGLNTDYAYNGFGDLLSLNSPDTGVTNATYDTAGNLKTRTDARGVTATYSYDVLNRVVGVAYPDTSRNVSYEYDLAPDACGAGERFHVGRLAVMRDASGSTVYCYDRYGVLSRKLQTTQATTYALGYLNTDPRGRLPGQDYSVRVPPPGNQNIGMVYPDGTTTRIVRDAEGRPRDLKVTLATGQSMTVLSGGVYYPFGQIAQWQFGNGRVLNRTRNQNGQPGVVQDASAGGISVGYEFDAAGNLKTLRNGNQSDPPTRRFAYDGLNRLSEVRDGSGTSVLQSYAYNATGDRTASTSGGVAQSYGYAAGSHLITSAGAEVRAYDAMGNTVRIGGVAKLPQPGDPAPGPGDPGPGDPPPGQTQSTGAPGAQSDAVVREFSYDDAGRMRQVKRDGVVAMDYLYNGRGERVYRNGGGRSVTTLYDEAGRWIGDYDNATGAPIQQVLWLDDLPVGLLVGAGANQKAYYLEADALGTPRVVIDPTRNVAVWRWDLASEAFGMDAPNEDPGADGVAFNLDMRFPGQRYDAASGLYYNYQRDYDPSVGRYVQSDPIGLAGGSSTFAYASDAPTGLIDPNGLESLCFSTGIGCGQQPLTQEQQQQRYDEAVMMAGVTVGIVGVVVAAPLAIAVAGAVVEYGALGALVMANGEIVALTEISLAAGGGYATGALVPGIAATPMSGTVAVERAICETEALGVSAVPQRIIGPWSQRDLARAMEGKGPLDMIPMKNGRGMEVPLELHHAGQMPGSAIHEVPPFHSSIPGIHPNKYNQGVTPLMRAEDAALHWQMRGQEMGNPPPRR